MHHLLNYDYKSIFGFKNSKHVTKSLKHNLNMDLETTTKIWNFKKKKILDAGCCKNHFICLMTIQKCYHCILWAWHGSIPISKAKQRMLDAARSILSVLWRFKSNITACLLWGWHGGGILISKAKQRLFTPVFSAEHHCKGEVQLESRHNFKTFDYANKHHANIYHASHVVCIVDVI